MDQAVLPEELVLVVGDAFGVGDVPGQAVDLEGHALVDRPQAKSMKRLPP